MRCRFASVQLFRKQLYVIKAGWISLQVFCGQLSGKQVSLESLHAYIDTMVKKVRDAQEHRVITLEERVKVLKDSVNEIMGNSCLLTGRECPSFG